MLPFLSPTLRITGCSDGVSVHNISRPESNNQRQSESRSITRVHSITRVVYCPASGRGDSLKDVCLFCLFCVFLYPYTFMQFSLFIPSLMRPAVTDGRTDRQTLTLISVRWIHALISACRGSDAEKTQFCSTPRCE